MVFVFVLRGFLPIRQIGLPHPKRSFMPQADKCNSYVLLKRKSSFFGMGSTWLQLHFWRCMA